jgi:hypothetical protein
MPVIYYVGDVSEVIVVTDTPPSVDLVRAHVATNVDSRIVTDLPNIDRDITTLVDLMPAARRVQGTSGGSQVVDLSGNDSVGNGTRRSQSVFYRDGSENMGAWRLQALPMPHPDTVQEVQVISSSGSAEFGKSPGISVNAVTKSGTNEFHGTALFAAHSGKFNANSDHVRTTLQRYRGRVVAWDVVNEAVADNGGLRDTVYLRKLGPGYIAEAFRLAREADPDALLLYNDYGGEGLSRKSDEIYALLTDLLQQGVPVSGAGLQMHLDATSRPTVTDISRNLRRLGDLGLAVNFSEMDVRVARVGGDTAAKLQEQRRVYHDVIAACVAEPRCEGATFWGFTDRHSWIDQAYGPDDPLPFDESYRVKPAYYGVLEALQGR